MVKREHDPASDVGALIVVMVHAGSDDPEAHEHDRSFRLAGAAEAFRVEVAAERSLASVVAGSHREDARRTHRGGEQSERLQVRAVSSDPSQPPAPQSGAR